MTAKPKICLLDDWQRVLRRAWSIRFSLLAAAFTAAEVVVPLFGDVLPRGAFVLLAFAACAACYGACRWLSPDNTILSLLLRCVIVGVIYPGIWLGVTGRTAEWKQLWGILLRFLPKGKKAA